jgi:uncharacterized protein (DUF2147 family)
MSSFGPTMPRKSNMLRPLHALIIASLAATQICAEALAPAPATPADAPKAPVATTPVGVWLHPNGRIKMKVEPCADALCAKLVWFKVPNDEQGRPRVDEENPDPALRARPLLGLTVLKNLRPNDEGTWEGGEVYNPDDGENYSTEMSMQPDGTLRVRGYVLTPILGKTLVWTRAP